MTGHRILKWGAGAALAFGALVVAAAPAIADYDTSTPPAAVMGETTGRSVAPASLPASVAPAAVAPAVIPASVPAAAPRQAGSSLPFTGADVEGTAVLGAGLIGLGLASRRFGRRRAHS